MTATTTDRAAVRVLPPLVPLAVILLGVVLQRVWPLQLSAWLPAPMRYWLGGAIIIGSVASLGVWAALTIRRSGQRETPWTPTTSIVQEGPYAFSRNPIYLQMVIACAGFGVLLANGWIVLLTPACAWALRHYAIGPEETYLEAKFGEEYLTYKRSVRRWL